MITEKGQILISFVQQGQIKLPQALVLNLKDNWNSVKEIFWIQFRGKAGFKENLNYQNLNLIMSHSLPACPCQLLMNF